MAKVVQAKTKAIRQRVAARAAENPAGMPATQAEAEAAAQVAEAIEEAKNGGKKPEPASKVEPEKQAAAPAQAPTVEKAEKATEEPEKQAEKPPEEPVKVFVGRGPGTPGWAEAYAGLNEAGTAKKFAADLAHMAGDISLAERVLRVDLNPKGFSIVHCCADEEVAKKLIAIPEAKKAEKGFVSNRRKPAMISLYVQKPSAFQPTEEVTPPMTAKLQDGAKGAEKLAEARKIAPPHAAAVQVSGGNGNDPRKGRPVTKTEEGSEKPREIDFEHLSWFEKIKCVVALFGIPTALAHLRSSIERTASGTSEWAAANKLLFTWGKTLGVEPQLVFINEDGTVRFELLTDSIARFFKTIVVSKEPRRVEELLSDAKACNRLRPDQIGKLSEMVHTKIAELDEAEKRAALEAAEQAKDETAKAKAETDSVTAKLAALEAELAKLRAAAATKTEPTAEDVAKKAAEEISPATPTATVQ